MMSYNSMRQASIPRWWSLRMTQETHDIKFIAKGNIEKEMNGNNINNKNDNLNKLFIVRNSK